jgi:hypothetical protein
MQAKSTRKSGSLDEGTRLILENYEREGPSSMHSPNFFVASGMNIEKINEASACESTKGDISPDSSPPLLQKRILTRSSITHAKRSSPPLIMQGVNPNAPEYSPGEPDKRRQLTQHEGIALLNTLKRAGRLPVVIEVKLIFKEPPYFKDFRDFLVSETASMLFSKEEIVHAERNIYQMMAVFDAFDQRGGLYEGTTSEGS